MNAQWLFSLLPQFRNFGLRVGEVIRLLLGQLVDRRKPPLEIRALSPETVQALKDADAGKTSPLKRRDL